MLYLIKVLDHNRKRLFAVSAEDTESAEVKVLRCCDYQVEITDVMCGRGDDEVIEFDVDEAEKGDV